MTLGYDEGREAMGREKRKTRMFNEGDIQLSILETDV